VAIAALAQVLVFAWSMWQLRERPLEDLQLDIEASDEEGGGFGAWLGSPGGAGARRGDELPPAGAGRPVVEWRGSGSGSSASGESATPLEAGVAGASGVDAAGVM